MATPKSSDYLDRVYTKIVEKNTSEYQTQIDALEKNLAAFKAKAKATIAAATATDMEKALNKLVEMGAIDETERDAAYTAWEFAHSIYFWSTFVKVLA